MGRPLNKKYFGNRNIGSASTTADDRIGGEGVGSVTINTVGGYQSGLPTATFSTPVIPGGVRATGIVHGNAKSAATTGNGTGYRVGDVLTVVGGTRTSAATFPVAKITTVGIPTVSNGGTLYDLRGSQNDRITFTHANLETSLIVEVATVSGSTVLTVTVVQAGIWNGTGAPTSMANGVGGFTATTTAGFPGGDANGNGLVLSFPANIWGVYSFGTVAVQGDYTVAATNPVSFTGGTGTGAAATIDFGVSGIEITEQGSGYISVSDAAITFGGVADGGAVATPVLTVDTGAVGSATNEENAILMTAYLTGGSATVVDIIRQVSTNRFKVTDGTRTGIVTLKSSVATAAGEGSVRLVDTNGDTYFATKITARKVVITRGTGTDAAFVTGSAVKWNMTAATADSLLIDNA
jgi:hypothetical protein